MNVLPQLRQRWRTVLLVCCTRVLADHLQLAQGHGDFIQRSRKAAAPQQFGAFASRRLIATSRFSAGPRGCRTWLLAPRISAQHQRRVVLHQLCNIPQRTAVVADGL